MVTGNLLAASVDCNREQSDHMELVPHNQGVLEEAADEISEWLAEGPSPRSGRGDDQECTAGCTPVRRSSSPGPLPSGDGLCSRPRQKQIRKPKVGFRRKKCSSMPMTLGQG